MQICRKVSPPVVVILAVCVEPEEGVEAPPGGRVLPVAVAQVPLAHRVRAVAALLQSLGRQHAQYWEQLN